MSQAAATLLMELSARIRVQDRDGALLVSLQRVESGALSIPELYDILTEFLVEVGAAWQRGETSVWQEHFATAVVRTIIEACHPLIAQRAAPGNGKTVLLATPPEEYHDLGLRMIADRFELAGWTAHLLGASLPETELASAVTALGADAVVLSASTHFHRLALKPYVDGLLADHPGLRIWVGGAAFAAEGLGWPAEMLLDPAGIPSLASGGL